MPTKASLDRFIALVEASEFIAAMEAFYAPNASMQENFNPPRVGKPALLEHERKALAGTRNVKSARVGPVFVDGDLVVIRWRFESESTSGSVTTIEELAYQRWEGDQIVQEQFFYDPAQMKKPADTHASAAATQ